MKQVRIKLTDETEEILEEIRLRLNCNWQTAANIAILNGRNAVGSGKNGITKIKNAPEAVSGEANDLYIDIYNYNNKASSKGTLIPRDFNPPESITLEASIEREGAIFRFKKWANAEKRRFECWNEAFRYACNSWLPKANPHLLIERDDGLHLL